MLTTERTRLAKTAVINPSMITPGTKVAAIVRRMAFKRGLRHATKPRSRGGEIRGL